MHNFPIWVWHVPKDDFFAERKKRSQSTKRRGRWGGDGERDKHAAFVTTVYDGWRGLIPTVRSSKPINFPPFSSFFFSILIFFYFSPSLIFLCIWKFWISQNHELRIRQVRRVVLDQSQNHFNSSIPIFGSSNCTIRRIFLNQIAMFFVLSLYWRW